MAAHEAFAYCEALVREHAHDRFLAALFAPAARRPLLHALYAFDLEIAQIAARVREPLAGEVRMQWWRDVLNGERAEEARANPVAAALQGLLAEEPGSAAHLQRLLDARSDDLYAEMMRTMADFERYAADTTGVIFSVAAGLLGATQGRGAEGLEQASRHAGIALRLTQVIRDIGADASRGHLYLPLDVLTEAGATPADVLAGRATPELARALATAADVALAHLAQAQEFIAMRGAAGAAFLELSLVPPMLEAAAKRGTEVFRTPVVLSSWRRQWILWRAARHVR